MRKILLIICLFILRPALAQDLKSIMVLNGLRSEDDMDESLIERYEALSLHPVRINLLSEHRLASCGLFTRYQIASLMDYRKNYGDILSIAELALVDGIGESHARALAPYVSFESRYGTGPRLRDTLTVDGEALARTNMKFSEAGNSISYASKLKMMVSDRLSLGGALKYPSSAFIGPPEDYSGSLAIYGGRLEAKLVLGDFNAKFGQGLIQWSGFSLSGFSSASSFAKHPSGIAPAWTLTPATVHRGVAADLSIRRWTVSSFYSISGAYGVNLTRYGRYGQSGMSVVGQGLASSDFRYSAGAFDFFGEGAYDAQDNTGAGLFGLTYNHSYEVKASAMLRHYPSAFSSPYAGAARASTKVSDETGVALALDVRSLTMTADALVHPDKRTRQLKFRLDWNPELSEKLSLRSRLSFRYKPEETHPDREELKMEGRFSFYPWLRLDVCSAVCHNRSVSGLVYAGVSIVKEKNYAVHLRGTVFFVDEWDDRIYVYERGLPGTFSVPAWYGRGCSLSAVASYKRRHMDLNGRFAIVDYAFHKEEKPGKAELGFQMSVTF